MRAVLRNPGVAALITFLIIFAGFWGAIYGTEIQHAFPFCTTFKEPWSVSRPAVTFWGLVLGTALLFFFRQWSDDNERSDQIQLLVKRVNTLPPDNFMVIWATL